MPRHHRRCHCELPNHHRLASLVYRSSLPFRPSNSLCKFKISRSLSDMGNCLISNIIAAQEEKNEPAKKAFKQRRLKNGDKKMMREEDTADSRGGIVRIRVVVTQKELHQLLNYKHDYSSVDELLSEMKLRSRRRISAEDRTSDGGINGCWTPALESIPEENLC